MLFLVGPQWARSLPAMFYATDTDWRAYVNEPIAPKRVRKPRARKPGELTVTDLRVMLTAREIKFTTKHTKAELAAMLQTGVTMRAAAQDRENARRKAKRLASA